MLNIITLFSKPIYISEITPVTKEELEFCKELEYEDIGNNKTYSINKQILNSDKLKKIKIDVDHHLKIYTKEILKVNDDQEFYLLSSWALKMLEKSSAGAHDHSNSLISGVVYLDVSDESGNIRFHGEGVFPRSINVGYSEFNVLNSQHWYVPPKNNMIILFPSSVYHDVTTNESKKTRYSLAFNCFVRGKFGEKEYELVLP